MGFFKNLKNKIFNNKDKENLSTYETGLDKSNKFFSSKLVKLAKETKKVNSEYFDKLEEILVEADCGINFTISIIARLVQKVSELKIEDSEQINEMLVELMFENYFKEESDNQLITFTKKPEILLVCGVNGVGKTTSIAKLANFYLKQNKKITLVAADTFRAGAKEQLNEWAKRLGVAICLGGDNEDPSSVCYSGVTLGLKNNSDLIIIDTAGRLHNKTNLMLELSKIKKVIAKQISDPITVYLVLDATTGQNGIMQAKAFKELIDIDGIVITKMDGTSKGGIILSIKEELNIKVKFIGLGEGVDDLAIFDLEKYLYGLTKGLTENE